MEREDGRTAERGQLGERISSNIPLTHLFSVETSFQNSVSVHIFTLAFWHKYKHASQTRVTCTFTSTNPEYFILGQAEDR